MRRIRRESPEARLGRSRGPSLPVARLVRHVESNRGFGSPVLLRAPQCKCRAPRQGWRSVSSSGEPRGDGGPQSARQSAINRACGFPRRQAPARLSGHGSAVSPGPCAEVDSYGAIPPILFAACRVGCESSPTALDSKNQASGCAIGVVRCAGPALEAGFSPRIAACGVNHACTKDLRRRWLTESPEERAGHGTGTALCAPPRGQAAEPLLAGRGTLRARS